jgi:hypothetical protein
MQMIRKIKKSISGRINTLGGMISNWTSKKQSTPALSSTEAEYQAMSECAQESMFTCSLLMELTKRTTIAIIYEDNLGAIFLAKNQQVSARTKHIDIRHNYRTQHINHSITALMTTTNRHDQRENVVRH